MPSATVTVREVKNKSTGLDISIPDYKEIPGLLGSTVEFNVVVVSRLSYFKSPKHKDTDVVQFMIPRKFVDFEQLHSKLGEHFSGTVFTPLPKKVLRQTEAVIKERKSKLEAFLKFLACTPKLSVCSTLLEFLGVNAIKAGRYRKGQVGESQDDDVKDTQTDRQTEEEGPPDVDLFGETEDVTESDMFGEKEEADIFTAESAISGAGADARLFEDQDLGGGIPDGEEQLLGLVPDARTTDTTKGRQLSDDEENADLLRIEDDLDKLLVLDKKTEKSHEEKDSSDQVIQEKPQEKTSSKPKLPEKPTPPKKPTLAKKPILKEKPPKPGAKPVLPRKPSTETPAGQKLENTLNEETTLSKGDNSALNDDDILKYIQDNTATNEEDLDLFS